MLVLSLQYRITLEIFKDTLKIKLFLFQPWDDETDMDAMLAAVKTIEMDGLVWGANKLVPIGKCNNNLFICFQVYYFR